MKEIMIIMRPEEDKMEEDKKKKVKKMMLKRDFMQYLSNKKEFDEWMKTKGKKNEEER